MSSFRTYLQLGFEHISDLGGYDHILFIVALCAVYRLAQWREVLVLVTAFTLGHSLTLALSAVGIVLFRAELIEFLIPVTILATALFNVSMRGHTSSWLTYFFALFFGLIHGLGFSNYFRAILGREESIIQPLFAFNIGVELGQLLIVAIILGMSYLFLNRLHVKQRDWTLFVSGAAAGIALTLIAAAKYW